MLPSAMRAAAAAALAAECAAAGDASGFQHLMGFNGAPHQAMHGTGGHQGAAGDPYQSMAGSAQQMGGTMHGMMPGAAAPLAGYGSGFEGWQMPGMGAAAAAAAGGMGMGMPPPQPELVQQQDPRRGSASSAGGRGSKADNQMPVDSTRPWLNLAS
jgi:hypothetical protein